MAGFVVALTGGIASGKTEVERRFAALGVAIVDADRIARTLVERGQPALADIVECFGVEMLAADGGLDRHALRVRIFVDAAPRRQLEAILHPRIRTAMRLAANAAARPYVVLAIPLLAENVQAYAWVDRIVVVDVPRERQRERLLRRDGVSSELADAMIDAQASREQRLAIADDIIDNDGPLDALDGRVAALHRRYLELATAATRRCRR